MDLLERFQILRELWSRGSWHVFTCISNLCPGPPRAGSCDFLINLLTQSEAPLLVKRCVSFAQLDWLVLHLLFMNGLTSVHSYTLPQPWPGWLHVQSVIFSSSMTILTYMCCWSFILVTTKWRHPRRWTALTAINGNSLLLIFTHLLSSIKLI